MRALSLSSVALLCALAPRPSEACDRPRPPPGFIAAMASRVVVATVKLVSGPREASLAVTEELKGRGPRELGVRGLHTERKGRFEPCQAIVVEAGKSYLFAIGEDGRVVDPDDGVLDLAERGRIEKEIALGGSASRADGELRAVLVAPRARYAVSEEIDLVVSLENAGRAQIELRYDTWPPERHSYCALRVRAGGREIAAVPVPIARKDIEDYFSKHGNRYPIPLAPGRRHLAYLPRVSSAKPGWGYKEELGFQYYPMPPGEYELSARCVGYAPKPLETGVVRVVVTP